MRGVRPAATGRAGPARRAAGFERLWISDHYHPWNDEQGHSAVRVVGHRRRRRRPRALPVTTGVTCPTVRIHPAVIAQAAATQRRAARGPLHLGVGSGEALNEHILGDHWPEADVRLEMLEEAVEVIRALWEGGQHSHHGAHYAVENARVYDLPDEPPPILVSGFGPKAIDLAARIGDGFCTTSPDADAIELLPPERRRRAASRPARRSASWPGRGRGVGDRAPAVAQRGPARRARADAPDARALRAGVRARHARTWSPSRPVRPRPRRARRRAPGSTPTPASTSSTSSRSAPTRTRSSPCWASEILPQRGARPAKGRTGSALIRPPAEPSALPERASPARHQADLACGQPRPRRAPR